MRVISVKEYRIKTFFLNEKIDKVAFDKGLIIEPNKNNEYTLDFFGVTYTYNLDQILSLKDDDGINIFKKYEEKFKLNVSEKLENDDDIIKDWKIQLDVKTTSKNIKEIYKAIELYIIPLIKDI
jgi:hypothetical protein